MLADAGVELGVTYPFPVISIEESEEHLQMAAQVIQDTLAASMAEPQVPPPLKCPDPGPNSPRSCRTCYSQAVTASSQQWMHAEGVSLQT